LTGVVTCRIVAVGSGALTAYTTATDWIRDNLRKMAWRSLEDRTLIIHIGVHKTGTSAVQLTFQQNPLALATGGVLYPAAGRPKDPAFAFGHHELPWMTLGRRVSSASLFEELLEEISKSQAHTVVLSSEEFDRLDDNQALAIARLLPGKKKIVFYYRRQSDVLQGMYGTEACFVGEMRPIADYAKTLTSELNYLRLARRWASAVGKDNLIIRPYDRTRFPAGDVVRDFLLATSMSHLHIPDGALDPNASLPWYAVASVQEMWKLGLHPDAIYETIYALQIACRKVKGPYDLLAPSEQRVFDAGFEDDNQTFLREFAPRHPNIFRGVDNGSDEEWHARRSGDFKALYVTLAEVSRHIISPG
jgi:hypothetical protein